MVIYATITRGSSRGSLQAVSEGGTSFFIPKEIFVKDGLKLKQVLSEDEFYSLKKECNYFFCYNKALLLLSLREHTALELKQKLLLKKFEPTIINKVLIDLKEEGSLNEERFAASFVDSRLRRTAEGKAIMRIRLLRKGVPSEVADKVLGEKYTDDLIDELIMSKVDKFLAQGLERDQIKFKLKKLGFSSYEINQVFERKF